MPCHRYTNNLASISRWREFRKKGTPLKVTSQKHNLNTIFLKFNFCIIAYKIIDKTTKNIIIRVWYYRQHSLRRLEHWWRWWDLEGYLGHGHGRFFWWLPFQYKTRKVRGATVVVYPVTCKFSSVPFNPSFFNSNSSYLFFCDFITNNHQYINMKFVSGFSLIETMNECKLPPV